ncbi:MAG TPA: histidine phosphatase family protein [Stellaceae bacterium]|nr:histidine phosphatase family protein [Stellaceae bacterium]
MTKIILTRHGHVEGIAPERFRGRKDIPLTALGEAQAQAVAARIAALWRPVAVYTSPLGRCVATGRAIAAACGIGGETLDDLIDLDFGRWAWLTRDDVRAQWPALLAAWDATPHLVRFPDGDSLQDLVARTANAVRFVVSRHDAGAVVVLVGHDHVNRALLLQLLDQPLAAFARIAQSPCALNEIDIVDGRIRVLRINDAAHLDRIG